MLKYERRGTEKAGEAVEEDEKFMCNESII